MTVWPTVVITTTPMPAPVAVSTPRREMPGVGGAGTVPALLCDDGVLVPRDLGEHVGLGHSALQPVDDVRQLDADVQQDRADHDVGQEPVDRHEVPAGTGTSSGR